MKQPLVALLQPVESNTLHPPQINARSESIAIAVWYDRFFGAEVFCLHCAPSNMYTPFVIMFLMTPPKTKTLLFSVAIAMPTETPLGRSGSNVHVSFMNCSHDVMYIGDWSALKPPQ